EDVAVGGRGEGERAVAGFASEESGGLHVKLLVEFRDEAGVGAQKVRDSGRGFEGAGGDGVFLTGVRGGGAAGIDRAGGIHQERIEAGRERGGFQQRRAV